VSGVYRKANRFLVIRVRFHRTVEHEIVFLFCENGIAGVPFARSAAASQEQNPALRRQTAKPEPIREIGNYRRRSMNRSNAGKRVIVVFGK